MNRYMAVLKTLDAGSFSKAAEELGYTQSAVSQMVRSLEEELHTTLFIRSRHGVSLTANGEELLPHIRKICNAHRMLWDKQKEMLGLKEGTIRIGSIASVSCSWLPELMRSFKQIYPGIQFYLAHQGTYTGIVQLVREGSVDVGFTSMDCAQGLQGIVLAPDAMMAVLPQGHPLAEHEAISAQQLFQEPFIFLEAGEYNELLPLIHAHKQHLHFQYHVADDYTIMAMVEKQLGVGILPDMILRRTGYAVTARPMLPAVQRNIGVVYKDRSFLAMASRVFLDHVETRFAGGRLQVDAETANP